MTTTPYRDNVRSERANRKLDHLLYVAPLKRLGFSLLVLLPWILVVAASRAIFGPGHGLSVYLISSLGPYIVAGLLPGLGIALLVDAEKNPRRFVLEASWWPLSLLWHFGRWILYGVR
ncbi:MAG TPA: hypothetical protein VFA98_10515 [Thermoanaerobaculia bacterium]|jgi:hypothetical protein|nr:hypothetical protein [Thermoanaerobaculia bacterium]